MTLQRNSTFGSDKYNICGVYLPLNFKGSICKIHIQQTLIAAVKTKQDIADIFFHWLCS